MKPRRVVMWVDPDFKSFIKVESAKNNESILDFTRKIAKTRVFKDDSDGDDKFEKRRFSFKI